MVTIQPHRRTSPARTIAFAGFLLLNALQLVQGQVNIEALRSTSSDSGLAGTLGINLALRTGNVELVELGIDGRVDYGTAKSSTLFLWRGELGFVGGDRFTNDGLLHLRHGRKTVSSVAAEVFGQTNYDKSRLLEFRALLGGGLRLGIVDARTVGLWLGVGYMFEHEVLDLPIEASHERRTDVHRASNYVAARITAGPQLVIAATGYAQPQIDDPGDIRIVNNVGIAAKITRTIALTIKFDLRYDSRPPDGIAGLDTTLRNGLTIAF